MATEQTTNPFANAIVIDDDENNNDYNPFSDAIVTGEAPVVDDLEQTEPEKDNPFQYIDDNPDLIGQSVDLPDPNTTMYNDIEAEGFLGIGGRQDAFQKALDRYRFYEQHPDSEKTLTGMLVYNNKVVPFPDQSFFTGDPGVDVGSKIVYGLRNAGVNILETGEILTDLAGITDDETTYIADNVPKLDTGDSTMDSIIVEGSGLIGGGGAVAKGVGFALKKAPQLVRTIGTALGFEIGAASSAESDAGTLVIGNSSLFKDLGIQPAFLEGLDVDSEDPKAQQELAKRLNILMDGMTAAGVLTGAVKGLDVGSRLIYNLFVDPFAKVGSISRKEQEFVREIVDQLIDVGDDPKAIEAARNKIADLITANKTIYVDLPEDLANNVQISVDSMTALERALRDENTDAAKDIIIKASALKKGVIQQTEGTNKTAIAVARPTDALENVTKEAELNLGGSDAITDANRAIQDQGVAEIDQAAGVLKTAEENLQNVNQRIIQELTEDPSIIGKATQLESKYGFDIGSLRENSADEIVAAISRASEAMDNQKNTLFNAIEGGAVDYNAMIDVLKSLKPGQLDAAASAMPGDNLFGTLLEQTKLRMKEVDGQMVRETTEEMQARFARFAERNGLDFAKLFTEIRPSLVDSINSLERGSAAEKGAAKALIKFKKYIDEDAMTYLEDVADDETLDAATEAMRYFREDWAPFWDDASTLQEIGTLRRTTTARGKQTPMFEDSARQQVKTTISDDNRSVAANMVKLLERPEAAADPNLVTDFIIGDVLSTLSTRLDGPEAVSDLGLNAVRQSLSRYSTLIRKNFGQEADRIDALVSKLDSNSITKQQLKDEVVKAQRLADEAKNRIYQQELNGFFTAQGVRNPNGYDTLSKIFTNQQSADRLTDLMARADDNPIIQEGIQAAYTRWFRNNFLGSTTSTAGDRTLKAGAQMANQEGVKNALEYADIVFKDKPEFVIALDSLLAEAGLVQRSRSSKAIPTGSGTSELTDTRAAIDRGITATLGVLSRTGARLRSAATGYIDQNLNRDGYFKMVDSLMSDPDEFVRVLKDVVRNERAVGTIPIRLPGTGTAENFLGMDDLTLYLDRGALYKMLVRAGIYREGNEEDQRSFMEKLAQTELDFTKARDEFIQSQELGIE